MKTAITALLLASAAVAGTPATLTTPPTASAGLLNDALRLQSGAWTDWDLGGQVRLRYEVKDDGGSFPNRDFIQHGVDNDNDYLLFREKFHIGWQPESWLKFYVEGRGAQAESDDREPSPDQDTWDLHQAFITLGDAKQFPLTLTLGRQELLYGDERFIGIGNWSNTGRSFDAAKLRLSAGGSTWVDLFTARLVIPRDDYFNESNDEDQFSGLYASTQELVGGLETQAYFLARNVGAGSPNAIATGIGGPSERDVYTYGVRLKSLPGAFNGWDFSFEGAGQFGDVVTSGVERDLQAYALFGSLGYTFDKAWGKPRIGLGYDYGSGDSDAKDGKQETFEQLFGTNHGYYGVMDLVGLRNINSPRTSSMGRVFDAAAGL
ncbi:MAG: alginate export family protein, partial [Roseimicrobium sp.]